MERLPNLPIGQQYFAEIRKSNSLYIDKTQYIYEICLPPSRPYFLSRPRRFGKSLTLDTIAELFSGNKSLFEGLWIYDNWDWSQTYPIIRLSLDTIDHKDGLEKGIIEALQDIAMDYDISLISTSPGTIFKELIKKIAQKTGKPVVILIDEYDRPIIDYIDPYNLEKANEHRTILADFFKILKNSSNHIRLLFITGVTKFAQVSIFSNLNHLIDLTLDGECAALCGYTQSELEYYFEPYLKKLPEDTLSQMKEWYNGYSWDAQTFVYNPFSVLNFFKRKVYSNFWFSTGTPTFLVRLLRKRFEYTLQEVEVNQTIFDSFMLESLDTLDINSVLLQTGYLTIKKITAYQTFILDYPNKEVQQSFAQFLLSEFTNTPTTAPYVPNILEALNKNDIGKVMIIIDNLIKSVPDQNYIKDQEKFFHAIIHLIFTIIGADPRSEWHTNIGRIDTVIITADRIFLFEFKMNETTKSAIQCIKDRKYPDSLRHLNKIITGIGVVFSVQKKGIDSWETEDL